MTDASLHSSISVPKSVAAYNQFVVIKLLFICVPRLSVQYKGVVVVFPSPTQASVIWSLGLDCLQIQELVIGI